MNFSFLFLIGLIATSSATAKISLSDLSLDNKVNGCFSLKINRIEEVNVINKHTIFIDVKRVKARGSDWQSRIDCCPKYTFPYLVLKDQRNKKYSRSLLNRPDEVGEMTETTVPLTEAIKDGAVKTPLIISTKCD